MSDETKYDSTTDTQVHIAEVQSNLMKFIRELVIRAQAHDKSKLESPEKEAFDEATPRLKQFTYGSEEYKESLKLIKPALDHHYSVNSHHPEHYPNGIEGMNLYDIVEMFCDWLAATNRTAGGDIHKSIDINEKRFNINPQLASIFRNTVATALKPLSKT